MAGSEAAPHRVGEVPGNAVDDDDQPPILLRWKGKGRAGDDDEGIPAGTETPQIAPPGVGGAGDKLVRHHSRDLILPERQSEVRLRHLSRSADSAADRPPTPSRSVTRSDGRAPAHPLGQTSEERGRSSRSCAKRRRVNPPRSDPRADEQADDEASPSARPEAIAPVSCQAPMHCQAPDPIGHASEVRPSHLDELHCQGLCPSDLTHLMSTHDSSARERFGGCHPQGGDCEGTPSHTVTFTLALDFELGERTRGGFWTDKVGGTVTDAIQHTCIKRD